MTGIPLAERLLLAYARGFPLERGKLRLVNALWRGAAGSHGTRRRGRLVLGGYEVPCELGDSLSRQLYFFGTYFIERRLLDLWRHLARDARTVFDIGANAGIYSLAARAAQPRSAIHAFEPTPELAARLREAVQWNRIEGLHVHERAVSSRQGYAILTHARGENDMNEGMNFLGAGPDPALHQTTVPTVALDGFCRDHAIARIDLMKIDVQGHEPEILEGAADLIGRGGVGTLLMELTWPNAQAAVDRLASAGYRFATPRRPVDWQPAGHWLEAQSDILASRPGD